MKYIGESQLHRKIRHYDGKREIEERRRKFSLPKFRGTRRQSAGYPNRSWNFINSYSGPVDFMKSPRKIYFEQDPDIPNSYLPVLLFRSVLSPETPRKALRFRKSFERNAWTGIWTDTVYDYMHYHSNTHEVLGIAEGKVTLKLGGETGRLFRLKAGDLIVLPAGVGHRRAGGDDRLKVVGAYPPGRSHFNMKRKGRRVPHVPVPATDPFYGENGPLRLIWKSSECSTEGT